MAPGTIDDGRWWKSKRAVPVKCALCPQWHKQRVDVIRYIPEMDHGDSWERDYPGVRELGWVLWAYHRKRGGGYQEWFQAVSEDDVNRWGRQGKGWGS